MSVHYTDIDRQQMRTAFAQLFGVSKEDCDSPQIMQWMEDAPVGCIEYDGRFDKETAKDRDIRMELHQVYEGDIRDLVEHLRRMFPEYRDLTKWALIFKVYSGIQEVQSVIRSAQDAKVFQAEAAKVEEPHVDDPQTDLSSSNEVKPNVVESTTQSQDVPGKQQGQDASIEVSSGKLEEQDAQPSYNTSISNIHKEEKIMDSNALMNAANAGAATTNPTATQTTGGKKVAVKPAPTLDPTMIAAARASVTETLEQRAAWTGSHFVSRVISPYEPNAKRVINAKAGVISMDETKAAKAVEKQIEKFETAVGMKFADMDSIERLSERFPHVTSSEALDRAEAIRQILLQLKQNPTAQLAVFVDQAPSISVKGYTVDGVNYSSSEFRDLLLAKSSGAIYAQGALVDGKPSNEGTAFILATATRNASGNAKKGEKPVGSEAKEAQKGWEGVIRPKNKKAFVEKAGNVVYVYPTLANATVEQQKNVPMKALIVVGGKDAPASFRYDVYENGQIKMTAPEASSDGKTKEAKPVQATYSLSLRVMVAVTAAAPIDEFSKDAAKFAKSGVSNEGKAIREALDYTNVEALKAAQVDKDGKTVTTALEKLLVATAQGVTITANENAEVASIVNGIKANAGNATAAQNAKDAKDLL